MAINGIQFQKGLPLAQFMKEYGTEAQCEQVLTNVRWPDCFSYLHKTALAPKGKFGTEFESFK